MKSGSDLMYIPEQSDIIWVTLDPTLGREQGGRRPALVLSARDYSARTNLATVCPITSRVKGYPWEVRVADGLKTSGVVLADHVRSLDITKRNIEFIERAPIDTLLEVFDKLESLLPGLCSEETA
jgi:mRNA interferase MazF